jgi:thymidylate kinase
MIPGAADAQDVRLAPLLTVFRAWREAGTDFSILHGFTPGAALGRDVDVLIRAGQERPALHQAAEIFRAAGFQTGYLPSLWGATLVAAQADWESAIEIHCVNEVSWCNACLAVAPGHVAETGAPPCAPWAVFSKCVLLPYLSGQVERLAAAVAEIAPIPADDFLPRLEKVFGHKLAHDFLDHFSPLDPTWLKAALPRCRRAAVLGSLWRQGWPSWCRLLRNGLRRVLARSSQFGIVVALVGPDGVGKSTVLRAITEGSKSIFTGIIVRHWRPRLLPNLGRLAGRAEPSAGTAPRRAAGRWPWLRSLYYALDYRLGHWWRDRKATATQKLVLYDRCALDMAADPLRFGLATTGHGEWVARHAPPPDLIVLLDDTPARIHARKAELDPSEIERQLSRWRQLLRPPPASVTIRVDAEAGEITRRVREAILAAFLRHLNPSP